MPVAPDTDAAAVIVAWRTLPEAVHVLMSIVTFVAVLGTIMWMGMREVWGGDDNAAMDGIYPTFSSPVKDQSPIISPWSSFSNRRSIARSSCAASRYGTPFLYSSSRFVMLVARCSSEATASAAFAVATAR